MQYLYYTYRPSVYICTYNDILKYVNILSWNYHMNNYNYVFMNLYYSKYLSNWVILQFNYGRSQRVKISIVVDFRFASEISRVKNKQQARSEGAVINILGTHVFYINWHGGLFVS